MEEETRYTKQDLETMRAWTLQRKIQVTQTRLIEWLGRYDWNVYVSFSGGKDSTVLGLGVWDYSNQPGNVLGQICPAFGLLWFFIMPLAIWAEDTTRYLIWAYDCAVYHSQEAPPTIAPYSLKSVYGDFICGR